VVTKASPQFLALLGAYIGLVVLLCLDELIGGVHIGVLAIIPLLLIGFYGGRAQAIATALICAVLFAVLDHDVFPPTIWARWPVETDAFLFMVVFLATLFTAERLRTTETAASHDPLTALPNRRMMFDIIDGAIDRARRSKKKLALLFVDLDGFKAVNDRHGHAVGDRVLQHAAQRLRSAVRVRDVVGRIGGDEFVILLEDVDDASKVRQVADIVVAALTGPFHEWGILESIGATAGIAMYPTDGRDTHALLSAADARMYAQKGQKAHSS
jgi:diguanylate cyclase (GGDEF)-like protein